MDRCKGQQGTEHLDLLKEMNTHKAGIVLIIARFEDKGMLSPWLSKYRYLWCMLKGL